MNPVQLLQSRIGVNPDGDFGQKSFNAFHKHFKITPIQAAHILGQCEHETGGFRIWEENLNYSAGRLTKVWPTRFSEESAARMDRKPIDIANHVYGGRMGNDQPNDGWNFRGRGAVQLTGRFNYKRFADYMNDPTILTNPDQVATKYAFDSALFFFISNKITDLMKDGSDATISNVTRRVNGGTHGLPDRIVKTKKYLAWV